jgi:hypothetical protein
MSTDALITGSAKRLRLFCSLVSKNPFRMDEKIVIILCLERSGTQIMLKCLNNLGVTAFLPPPGGAQAQTNLVSLICLNTSFFVS